MKIAASFFAALLIFSFLARSITAQNNCSNPSSLNPPEIEKCLSELNNALNLSIKATQPLESQLNSMQNQINGIKNRVRDIESSIIVKKVAITEGYKNLDKQQKILERTIRDFYIKSYYNSPLLAFLEAESASEITQILAYQKAATDQDKIIITNIAMSIQDLETKKSKLEAEEKSLISIKANLDEQSEKLNKIVSGARAYQGSLSGQIAALSAKQREILGARLAGLNIPLYALSGGGCSSDLTNGKDPGFSGGFGLFTYGVPNRVGLNQYGAFGRAKAGQNADAILKAYYDFSGYKSVGDITIRVNDSNGYDSGNIIWSGSLNEYIKRIYEVPNDWPYESIKAQVIAARSYVIAATNNGASSICANQYCQVFQQGEKGGTWGQAVNDTGTDIMEKDGQAVKAFFSSTHGGYVFTTGDLSGWSPTSFTKRAVDTPSGSVSNFDDLKNNAYDKDSPWFYCDWGSRSNYGGTAWLKPEEMADIINVLLLVQRDSGTKEHLYQVDKPNPAGTDTWDAGRVKQELSSRGGSPFNNLSSVSVGVDFGSGQTTSVNINGDAGSTSFSGSDFKTYFNLRAPANIQIVGPLYNVERK